MIKQLSPTNLIENWKVYNNTKYSVSDWGNVRNDITGRLLKKFHVKYTQVTLCENCKCHTFKVHNLVWVTFNGSKNGFHIDHIDNDKTNNKLTNLQLLTHRENISKAYEQKKTSSSFTGVYFSKRDKGWRASIMIKRKPIYLGSFKNEIEAHNKYQEALKLKINNIDNKLN